MAGALAERDFVEKLQKVGFTDVDVVDRKPYGIKEAELYPLFTEEVLDLMRTLIPPEKQDHVATSIVVTAHSPR